MQETKLPGCPSQGTDAVTLIATTAFGLEAVTKRELVALGYSAEVMAPGWIRFEGTMDAIARANLWLRTADRVLVQVASFEARDFDTLFETSKRLPWDRWIPVEGAFPVDGRSIKSQLSSVPAIQRATKKSIVESLMASHGVETLPETAGEYRCQVAILKDQVTLTIDTTGPSLHKRGYRRYASVAPLKETMAAALVQLSFWNPERPLLDPFCGSGTIPIEAALIGRNLAPGLQRAFAAEKWPVIPAACWERAREEAKDLAKPSFEEKLIGTDIDGKVLQTARYNASLAGVEDQIHFQQRAFLDTTSKRQHGCVISNPPYGERLDNDEQLRETYESIPEVLRALPTWSHFILTAYPRFEDVLHKKADRRRKLYNGRIECTYYQFHGPGPGKAGAWEEPGDGTTDTTPTQVFGGTHPRSQEQADLFASRLKKRARHLRRWPTRQGITCYRLYERDIPEIPLVVDRYEDFLHITEYERPHDRDRAQHVDWLEVMQQTAAEVLEVPPTHVFLKRREPQRGKLQHQPVARRQVEVPVQEGGLQFLVNLSDYVDTGLFLDHRITRSMVRDEAQGGHVLNLFGYTGSFSVYAAAGGARKTTTVDLSGNYLEWAKRNMEANGFVGDEHQFIKSDGRAYVQGVPEGPRFDLAVVDPPTFSNSKDLEDWILQDHWDGVLNDVVARMKPGGVIYFSTNYRRFKFDAGRLQGVQAHEISKQTVPEDFRNRRIHRCWRITCP